MYIDTCTRGGDFSHTLVLKNLVQSDNWKIELFSKETNHILL